jgi:hypothetical protein
MNGTPVSPPLDAAPQATFARVRERTAALAALAHEGRTGAFRLNFGPIDALVEAIAARAGACSREAWHGRLAHLEPEPAARLARFSGETPLVRARAAADFVVVSVLLDAGAGPRWSYRLGDARLTRSEGLAAASYAWLARGGLSTEKIHLVCDGVRLAALGEAELAEALQVDDANPIVGLAGRAATLRRLGHALATRPAWFGDDARPGAIVDRLVREARDGKLDVSDAFDLVLEAFGPVWPGVPGLGDVWPHPALGDDPNAWVPFHKLAQWLTVSLAEPLAWAGVELVASAPPPPLAEYRNGGLLLDRGVLAAIDPAITAVPRAVGDPIVVEWRALTVSLLDRAGPAIRARLGASAGDLRVAGAIERASWSLGRELARAKRIDGASPLALDSDGTVF